MLIKNKGILARLIMVVTTLLFVLPAAQAYSDELALYQGQWTGFYQPDEGEREKATYLIKESKSGNKPGLSITIQLGYFPKEDWRFKGENLEVEEDSIQFQFGKNSFQLNCKLKQNKELELVGKCKPIDDSEGSTASKITMIPPQRKEKAEDEDQPKEDIEAQAETETKEKNNKKDKQKKKD